MRKTFLLLALSCALFAGAARSEEKVVIGLSFPTLREASWQFGYTVMQDYAKAKGIPMLAQAADADQAQQTRQVEDLLTKGINALIIGPCDGAAAAVLANECKSEGVPVICYDRIITNTPNVDYYVAINPRRLGETLPMYTEMFAFDQSRNSLLMGHAAMNCLDIAGDNPISIIPDAECGALNETGGAWLHFKGKAGPVLVSGLFDTGGGAYRATTFSGTARYSDLLDTSPNVLVEIEPPLRDFYRRMITTGMTQHFSLSYDDIGGAWEKFCEVAGIEHVRIC